MPGFFLIIHTVPRTRQRGNLCPLRRNKATENSSFRREFSLQTALASFYRARNAKEKKERKNRKKKELTPRLGLSETATDFWLTSTTDLFNVVLLSPRSPSCFASFALRHCSRQRRQLYQSLVLVSSSSDLVGSEYYRLYASTP